MKIELRNIINNNITDIVELDKEIAPLSQKGMLKTKDEIRLYEYYCGMKAGIVLCNTRLKELIEQLPEET